MTTLERNERKGADEVTLISSANTPPLQSKEQDERKERTVGTQHVYWCFTWNNFDNPEQLLQTLKHECDWVVCQEETGAQGTKHLQGTLKLMKRNRLNYMKKLNVKIHWEPTKSVKSSIEYCTKYETRTGKIYSFGIELPEPIDIEEPYGWQLEVMKIIKEKPNNRTINWFWEEKGNVGKSVFCKYLVVKHNALMLTGKSNDMFYMLKENPTKRKLIIVDVSRSQEDFINYGAIEQIKNGLIFSGKYECQQLVFNSPHVICFSNSEPAIEKMSKDRWNIVNIRLKM